MKGKILWDYMEQEARRKFNKNSYWHLIRVEIIDKEIAKVMLEDKGLSVGNTVEGLIVYTREEMMTNEY